MQRQLFFVCVLYFGILEFNVFCVSDCVNKAVTELRDLIGTRGQVLMINCCFWVGFSVSINLAVSQVN